MAVFADSVDAVAAEAAALDGVAKVLTVTTSDNGFRLAAALAPPMFEARGLKAMIISCGTLGIEGQKAAANARAAVEAHLNSVETALSDQQKSDRNETFAQKRLEHEVGR